MSSEEEAKMVELIGDTVARFNKLIEIGAVELGFDISGRMEYQPIGEGRVMPVCRLMIEKLAFKVQF